MFYTIYKITNKVNEKIYIGVHKTEDIDDGYMGSGKIIKRAHKKYGIANFEKEILKTFETEEEMYEMESLLVNADFIKRDDTYNLKEGGHGGFDHINSNESLRIKKNKKARQSANENGALEKAQKALKKLCKDPEWVSNRSIKARKTIEEKYPDKNIFRTFVGKTHSIESKQKMSEGHKGKHIGKKNSQYGTMWIHSLKEKRSKRIKKEDLLKWESKGWNKGRIIDFSKEKENFCNQCGTKIGVRSSLCRKCNQTKPTSTSTKKKISETQSLSKEKDVVEMLQVSNSIAECMQKLGYKGVSGNALYRIRRIAKKNNIHF